MKRVVAAAGTLALAAAVNIVTGMLTQHWAAAWWAFTGCLVVVGGGLQAWFNQVESGRPDPVDRAALEPAAARLAEQVDTRLRRETERRDVWRPAPIPLQVRPTDRPVQAPPGAGGATTATALHSDVASIGELFRALPIPQLAVLGEPGAGKTVLAMVLALDLIREPAAGGAVPVFLSLSTWNPDVRLDTWIVDRLVDDFGFLRGRAGREIAQRLLDTGRVLPVLDGLDEIPTRDWKKVITRVDVVFGPGRGYVLTCRAREFEDAVARSGVTLSRATVVEIGAITAETAAGYLRASATGEARWQPVLDELAGDPAGRLAAALSTPLTLYLLRIAYEDPATEPAELLDRARFGTSEEIEAHLLDAFVPAAYDPYHRPRYTSDQAQRWLGTLALGPRELSWWNLASDDGISYRALLVWALSGWACYLVTDPLIAFGWGLISSAGYVFVEKRLELDRLDVVGTGGVTGIRRQLRAYRAFAALCATAVGVAVGGLVGAVLGGGLGAGPSTVHAYAAIWGLAFGLLALLGTAWGEFFRTRIGLALSRRLPLRLLRFLEDAHRRGVLRRPVDAYQFRHARLQDRLRPVGVGNPFGGGWPSRSMRVVVSRPRAFARLLRAPALRLAIQLGFVIVPALLFALIPLGSSLHHQAGAGPDVTDNSICGQGGCIPDVVWAWPVSPAGTTMSTLVTDEDFLTGPRAYRGLNGDLSISGCPDAVVELSVTTDTPADPAVLRLDAHAEIDAGDVPWRLPQRFRTLTMAFRRLDTAPCMARVEWSNPQLILDQFVVFTGRFRD